MCNRHLEGRGPDTLRNDAPAAAAHSMSHTPGCLNTLRADPFRRGGGVGAGGGVPGWVEGRQRGEGTHRAQGGERDRRARGGPRGEQRRRRTLHRHVAGPAAHLRHLHSREGIVRQRATRTGPTLTFAWLHASAPLTGV